MDKSSKRIRGDEIAWETTTLVFWQEFQFWVWRESSVRVHAHTQTHTCTDTHMHTNIHEHFPRTFLCPSAMASSVRVQVHTQTHTHAHTQTHTRTYTYTHTRTDTHTQTHTHTSSTHLLVPISDSIFQVPTDLWQCMCVCVCTCVCMCSSMWPKHALCQSAKKKRKTTQLKLISTHELVTFNRETIVSATSLRATGNTLDPF
jgi:hypothetical protein